MADRCINVASALHAAPSRYIEFCHVSDLHCKRRLARYILLCSYNGTISSFIESPTSVILSCSNIMASSSNAMPSSLSGTNSKVASGWLAAQSTFVTIAALLVFTRIYVRSIIIKKIGLDDILIVIA